MAVRLEFSGSIDEGLSWAFNIVGKLEIGEAIATKSEHRVLQVGCSGLPEQREKADWLAETPVSAKSKSALSAGEADAGSAILVLVRCSALLDPIIYERAFRSNSWIGSYALNAAHHSCFPISLKVGAGTHKIGGPESIPTTGFMAGTKFYACYPIGAATQQLKVRLFNGRGTVANVQIDVGSFLDSLQVDKALYYGTKVSTNIGIDICMQESVSAEEVLADLSQSASLAKIRDMAIAHINSKQIATSAALEERISAMASRGRVRLMVEGAQKEIGLEPSNENETVIIAARLEEELSKKFFGHFAIREYTSREGIDSIVWFKRSAPEPAKNAKTEFEYDFRNFFRHRHPFQQVDLIICWTMSGVLDGPFKFGGGDYGTGELSGTLEPYNEWVKVIAFPGHTTTVIPLSRLPNLTVEP